MSDERPPERDETRPMESVDPIPPAPGGEPGADETHPMDPVAPMDPVTGTRPAPAADATRIQPSGGPRSDDRDNAIWTGRAEVRPPRPGTEFYETPGDWAEPVRDETQSRWWAPIAVGSAALVLLGLLGFGIAVIVQNTGEEPATPPAPVATTTTATTTAATTGTTSAAATTDATTPPTVETTPPTTDPVDTEVNVPALRGMPVDDAKAALERTGLSYRVIQRESEAEPGTVIDSDPPEGSLVPSDARITLVVATEPSPDPVPTTTTTPPAGEPGED
ncbi:PASTA domain-containing protein [Actinoplanes sp. DH11]|uniref:PASTA domain-containing protein n=1 Tax=Actinoplanes sp. DH11 TaxID=2857011 RepID=UPI001E4DCE4B|nr:PASTA domain-containing protein [Actinoplanes sp. DH11]